jgi:predicted deacylase
MMGCLLPFPTQQIFFPNLAIYSTNSVTPNSGMSYFSTDYFTARSRWKLAANALGCRLESHKIDAVSPINEPLTIDVAMLGNPLAHKAVVISSGLHGVEGLFGSAVQLALLEQHLTNKQLPSDLAIVIIHTLNPFGCAWYRRWNEDNIDLNRNFLVADQIYQGCPPAYPQLDSFLNPQSPPSKLEPFLAKSLGLISRYGMSTLKKTLPVGQYQFPQGLFFGGKTRSQTNEILTAHLRRWIGLAQQVLHLDLHSGLGKWGTYQLFAELTSDSPRYQWLSQHFDNEHILTLDPEDLVYQSRGTFGHWCQASFPDLTYDFLLAEFGTYSMLRVLKALRSENRAYWWGQPKDKSYQWAKQELLEVFVPKNLAWRSKALQQGVNLCLTAIS